MNEFKGVIVDAGHGGIDSGAVGNGMLEKNLNLDAARYMYKRLQELGIPAVLVRDEDIYLPKDERIRRILNIYGNSPNTILVSNHINAGGGEGAEVVYSLKNNSDLANLVLDGIGSKGQIKRKVYQRRLPENPNKDYYYILRETGNTTPILVEYGFIDNKNDAYKLKNNLLDYVEGAVEGIATYLGYPYYPVNEDIEAKEEYIVKNGDTLYSLSKKFNISVDEIKRINNLNSDILSVGQILKLTDLSDNIYIVQKGDTLYNISKKYNITVNDLIKENNLISPNLSIGDKLIIPNNEIIEENIVEYDIYEIKKGDSLWSISQKYKIPLTKLIEINNLLDLNIKENQKLLVPKIDIPTNTYIVQKGDTLWSIAKKNNIEVEKLKEINNLTNNLLSVGQELIITG